MRIRQYISWVLPAIIFLTGCDGCRQKQTNWRVSLARKDKKPYGCYLSYTSLQHFFPGSKVSDLSPGFRYSNIDEGMRWHKQPALLVAAGLDFYLSTTELNSLIGFAEEGNEVFIFARSLDDKMEEYLRCSVTDNRGEEMPLSQINTGISNQDILRLASDSARSYGYQGRSLKAKFTHYTQEPGSANERNLSEDDQYDITPLESLPDTLGYCDGAPNMLRYKVGDGHITVHTAPLAISNYFLLQPGNEHYLAGIWSTLPADIGPIYWNSYYKRNSRTSDLGVLLAYPATRWAFILALFTLAMYLLFESKRKQRIIAEIPPLENTSATFAETVGRLYYNKGDHLNLAEKMVQHYLEWVRTHYFISTNRLDKHFSNQLQLKSGLPVSVVHSMIDQLREVQVERKPMTEADLYHLHQTIQQFYKNHSK